MSSTLSYPRVGIIVPRFQRTIVERNTLRRRLRELVRRHLLPVIQPRDVLIRANPRAYGRSFAELEGDMHRVVGQLTRGAST